MAQPKQDGLEWKETLFGQVPQWTRDPRIPAIENVCRQQLKIAPQDPCTVSFHTSGLFNKLYTVKYATHPRRLMMRVTLPVYPRRKMRVEVATLRWVRENTSVPAPKVFGFDDSNNNEIGFEWILMEFMEGAPASGRWWTMSMDQKIAFTERIATFQSELSGFGRPRPIFKRIGTLDASGGLVEQGDDIDKVWEEVVVAPGLLVSPEFFVGDHLRYDIPRGPFHSTHDWLSTQLKIILLHQTATLESTEDEDDREDAEEILSVAQKLLALVPKVFPLHSDESEPEATGLYHHDLHLNNILVNDEGAITAILDWECVSALPHWMLTMPPKFLEEPVREEEPERDEYADEVSSDCRDSDNDETSKDDKTQKNPLYYIHRMEYEATQLRKVYEVKLRELWPEWLRSEGKEKSWWRLKADFFQAISQCDGIWVGKSDRWAESIEKGEIVRFEDV
ncbi:hypothetical protein OQA88_12529 [Cercophora sp. LCS_1]